MGVKAKVIQATKDMRTHKISIRRLTLTEFKENESKGGGRLNDSMVDALTPQ